MSSQQALRRGVQRCAGPVAPRHLSGGVSAAKHTCSEGCLGSAKFVPRYFSSHGRLTAGSNHPIPNLWKPQIRENPNQDAISFVVCVLFMRTDQCAL